MPLQYPQRFYEQLHQPYSFLDTTKQEKPPKAITLLQQYLYWGLELNEQKLSFYLRVYFQVIS